MKITEVVGRLPLTPFSFISLLNALSLNSKLGTAQCSMSSTTIALEVFFFSIPLAHKFSFHFNSIRASWSPTSVVVCEIKIDSLTESDMSRN